MERYAIRFLVCDDLSSIFVTSGAPPYSSHVSLSNSNKTVLLQVASLLSSKVRDEGS